MGRPTNWTPRVWAECWLVNSLVMKMEETKSVLVQKSSDVLVWI